MHHLSQNGIAQLIRNSSTDLPRVDFELQFFTLTAELDGVPQLTERGGSNIVVVEFKSLTDVTVWVQANLPSDTPKSEHFIDLDILLAKIERQE